MRYVFTILRNWREKRSASLPLAVVIHVSLLRTTALFMGCVRLSSTSPAIRPCGRGGIPLSLKRSERMTRVMAIERSRVWRDVFAALMDIALLARMSWLRAKETTLGRISWTITRTTFDFVGMSTD